MNVRTDPLLRVLTAQGPARLSLPGLLAALGADRVESLPGLQRHQEDAFHIFLCYLAAAALVRQGRTDPAQPESFWQAGLLALAGGEDDAWRLLVEDPTQPAFFQPPSPNPDAFSRFRLKARTPDGLEVLNTAKNHDLKSERADSSSPEQWVYALVTLQTTAGFFGQGNYGISRMNGGFGSRPCVALRHACTPGGLFLEETRKLLDAYAGLLAGSWGYRAEGLVLTWLPPWDGVSGLAPAALHPFFIEVCRKVRLAVRDGRLAALSQATRGPRVLAKELHGVMGDPWIPVTVREEPTALTVAATGLTPRLLRDLLFEEGYSLQPMQRPAAARSAQEYRMYASVLVRGQGTTEGFHQASVPVPGRVVSRLFGGGPGRTRLAALSRAGLEAAAQVQSRVIRPALYALLEAGPDKLDFDKKQLTAWVQEAVRAYGAAWAEAFFPWLWNASEEVEDSAALAHWQGTIRDLAFRVLQEAERRLPARGARRFRGRVRAQDVFFFTFHKLFPPIPTQEKRT